MSRIKRYLQREVLAEWSGFPAGAALWQNRLWYYLWFRTRLLIGRSFLRTLFHSLQFGFMGYFFPVFEWSSIFMVFQLLTIYEGAIWGLLEPLRKELREQERASLGKITQIAIRYRRFVFGLAVLPWILFALWWGTELSRPERVFGFHDLMILVFVARTSIQIIQTWIQSVIFYRDRYFISFATWFLPMIVPAVVICVGLGTGGNPWWIPLGYVVETLLGNFMIWRRWIKVDMSWFHEPLLPRLIEWRKSTPRLTVSKLRLLGYGTVGALMRAENWVLLVVFGHHMESVLLLMGLSPLLKIISQVPNLFWVEMTRQTQRFYGYFLKSIERRMAVLALILVGIGATAITLKLPPDAELFIWIQFATLVLSVLNYVFLKFFFKDPPAPNQPAETVIDPNAFYHRVYLQKALWRHLRSRKIVDRFAQQFPQMMLFHRTFLLPTNSAEPLSASMVLRMIYVLRGFFDHTDVVVGHGLLNPIPPNDPRAHEWVPFRFDLTRREWSPSPPTHSKLDSPRDQAWVLRLVLNHFTPVGRIAIDRLRFRYRRDSDAVTLYLKKPPELRGSI
ncbi:MAG: hypothetical protein JST80_11325 [Bdellovibrionales bacterium]|nr:hypothetical protein [Bdellovibrionales bacterium]